MLVEGEEGDNAPLTPHEEWCLLVYKPLVLTLIESITQPDTPTYQESVQVQAAVAAAPTPYVAAVQRSNKTSDFVCFECGAVRGRYQHWDECLSHVRMHHPEIETRRKDDKANIREQCRKAAQLTSSSLSSTAVPSSADAKKSSVGSLEFQAPDKVWACFLQLQRLLFRNAEERTHESIREVSPRLAALSSTATHIILPTTGDSHQDSLRLTSLDDVVTLITTKTRPKQLSMHSADGKRRAYLLKGREDLHLDERVMQFLEVANDLVRGDRMRAVRFAVVPLGTQVILCYWFLLIYFLHRTLILTLLLLLPLLIRLFIFSLIQCFVLFNLVFSLESLSGCLEQSPCFKCIGGGKGLTTEASYYCNNNNSKHHRLVGVLLLHFLRKL